jgi:hypothetical protein
MADPDFSVHGNTASAHLHFAVLARKMRVLQFFYMNYNGHMVWRLIFIPKRKKEVHGKVGRKI